MLRKFKKSAKTELQKLISFFSKHPQVLPLYGLQ